MRRPIRATSSSPSVGRSSPVWCGSCWVTERTSADEEVDPWGPWYLANADVLAGGEPSHSIAGTAADMAMLFQALTRSGLWKDGIVEDATRIRRSEPPYGDKLYGGSDEV